MVMSFFPFVAPDCIYIHTSILSQGDPNVPAGQVSVRVDLKRPMILSGQQQQASVRMLAEIDTADLPPGETLEKLPPQSFQVPPDCQPNDVTAPSTCRAR